METGDEGIFGSFDLSKVFDQARGIFNDYLDFERSGDEFELAKSYAESAAALQRQQAPSGSGSFAVPGSGFSVEKALPWVMLAGAGLLLWKLFK